MGVAVDVMVGVAVGVIVDVVGAVRPVRVSERAIPKCQVGRRPGRRAASRPAPPAPPATTQLPFIQTPNVASD